MILIKNVEVYAPKRLGRKDVFAAGSKICRIADHIELPSDFGVDVIDGSGLILTPGFIDGHVHVLGGGGEGGFNTRTPEATLSGFTRYGITTVVGCLGTDGVSRSMESLIAKVKGLRKQGITAYCNTGSYRIPVRTLTGDIMKDIMFIEEVIGAGELAISDHRSSQPTFEEFVRAAADVRVGGMLAGKAGVINVHIGDSPRCLDLIERVVDETEIPITQFLPTHINRNAMLFERGLEFCKRGGTIDFTGNEDIDYWETICDEVRVCKGIRRMLDEGIDSDLFTITSDGQGSLPIFSPEGNFLGTGVGKSSCLLKEIRECVEMAGIPLEIAIKGITSNPARVLGLSDKGVIEEGKDADFCLMTPDLKIDTVIAMGRVMVRKGEIIVKGDFE